jgi:hypothetical protein
MTDKKFRKQILEYKNKGHQDRRKPWKEWTACVKLEQTRWPIIIE